MIRASFPRENVSIYRCIDVPLVWRSRHPSEDHENKRFSRARSDSREFAIPRRSDERLREFPSGTRAFSGRGSAGFRGEIARWLKTAVVYQSYVGGRAVTSRPSIPCRRLPSRSFDTGFFWSSPSGMVSAGARIFTCRIIRAK